MPLNIPLNPTLPIPLHRQIYQSIREAILGRQLGSGERLPSTRALAESLGVSRMTVTLSYEQLLSEGYIDTAIGSGTFVTRNLTDGLLERIDPPGTEEPRFRLSEFGRRLQKASSPGKHFPAAPMNFHNGRPDYASFPHAVWRRLLQKHSRKKEDAMFDYARDGQGYRPLREAIALYLGRSRNVRCTPDQVLIVNGSQQAIDLISRLLLNVGDTVVVEDPCYLGARRTFEAQGARLAPIAVDEDGLDVRQLNSVRSDVRVVYVTPSHQFPSGFVLPLERRLQLLDWARDSGAVVIEDDYDSEYRYGGYPLPSLQGLAEGARVIYTGTFSKVLFPALRLGYIVAPRNLTEILVAAKWISDRQSPMLEQFALADFISEGHLERHIRRMRTLYDHRRRVLVSALQEQLGSRVVMYGESAGIHIMVRFVSKYSAEDLKERCYKLGLGIRTARHCFIKAPYQKEFILGYANLPDSQIREGVKRIAKAIGLKA